MKWRLLLLLFAMLPSLAAANGFRILESESWVPKKDELPLPFDPSYQFIDVSKYKDGSSGVALYAPSDKEIDEQGVKNFMGGAVHAFQLQGYKLNGIVPIQIKQLRGFYILGSGEIKNRRVGLICMLLFATHTVYAVTVAVPGVDKIGCENEAVSSYFDRIAMDDTVYPAKVAINVD